MGESRWAMGACEGISEITPLKGRRDYALPAQPPRIALSSAAIVTNFDHVRLGLVSA